jgi:gas vesicle protein
MKNSSKGLVALITGLAAGVALGLLFAPDKGTDTRDKLADSLKDLSDSIKEKASEEIDSLTDFKNKVVTNIKSKLKMSEEKAETDDYTDEMHTV